MNLIPNKLFRYYTIDNFSTHSYNWYFIISFIFYSLIITFENIYSSFEDFWWWRRHFHIFQECLKIQRQRNIIFFKSKMLWNIYIFKYINECVEKKSMTIVCNIWIICLELNWLFYDPSWMLQLSEFVLTLRSSAWVVFNNVSFYRRNSIEIRLEAIKSAFFRHKPVPPFIFREHSLLNVFF